MAIALRGVATTGLPDVDLRQGEFQYRADTQQVEGYVHRAGLALAILLVLGSVYFGMRWYTLSHDLTRLQHEIVQLVGQVLPKSEMNKVRSADDAKRVIHSATRELMSKINKMEELQSNSVLEIMRRFSAGVPGRDKVAFDVDKITYKSGNVKISTIASSSTIVDQIRKAIESSMTTHKSEDGRRELPPEDGGVPLKIEFPPAGAAAKGGLKFDVIIHTPEALKQAARQKKGRRRRRR